MCGEMVRFTQNEWSIPFGHSHLIVFSPPIYILDTQSRSKLNISAVDPFVWTMISKPEMDTQKQ